MADCFLNPMFLISHDGYSVGNRLAVTVSCLPSPFCGLALSRIFFSAGDWGSNSLDLGLLNPLSIVAGDADGCGADVCLLPAELAFCSAGDTFAIDVCLLCFGFARFTLRG